MDQDKFCDLGNVDQLDESGIDLTAPPTSGELYLRQVVVGRSKCQEVAVTDRDFTHYSVKQTVQVPAGLLRENVAGSTQSCPIPPASWRKMQVAEFDRLRTELSQRRAEIVKNFGSKIRFPPLGDEDGWKRFCFETCSPQIQGSVDSFREKKQNLFECHTGTPPLLTIVASLTAAKAVDLFEFHVGWFAENGYRPERMHWLYALMLLIEKPLTPDACSALRELAREFSKIRQTVTVDDKGDCNDAIIRSYYLFLCLIVDYFGQRDLAEW